MKAPTGVTQETLGERVDWEEPENVSTTVDNDVNDRTQTVPANEGDDGVSLDDFYAYMPEHKYIFIPTRDLWPASSVDARIPPIAEGEEKVKLPNADQATDVVDQRVELVTVNVTKDGLYLINGVEQTSSQYLRYLHARKDEGGKLEIVVRGDKSSEFSTIQRIMRLSAEAGVADVSLAALQMADNGGQE